MSAINYDLSKIRGMAFDIDGVLSPSTIPMDISGTPQRMVNIKDGYALQLAVKRGLRIAIISGADSQALKVRYAGLGITDIYLRASVKLPVLAEWMAKEGLTQEEVAYAGDDIPDIEAMRHVGLGIAPADAAPEVKETAGYISPVPGGYGVARDLIEQVLRDRGEWMSDAKAFGW